ncbi:Rho GTPase activation protein [Linderina pennispora]|uniref:Rho GTPase activation protein n=1 Tax=Linderina pennispora TaxID=61395 RepID=A0A1Y1VXE0_9FUNG|nr:Rho GTPase activation protein [Linderina pennispora]ORX65666.1 Rho GTPase activation protein [Linderina pennispora]
MLVDPPDSPSVMGMKGRHRLQKDASHVDRDSIFMRNGRWCDFERKNLAAYEYLCHVSEAKEWIEACISEELPEIDTLEDSLRNGVGLAKLARTFCPEAVGKIYQQDSVKRSFKYTDNINFFLQAIRQVKLPRLFHFELTDLYDRKNMPRVIYCVHALSHFLVKMGIAPGMKDLVGHLEFSEAQLRQTQAELDNLGLNVPSFHQKERIAREQEAAVLERRKRLESERAELERRIVGVQALIRGRLARKLYADMRGWIAAITRFQALCRGYIVREEYGSRLSSWKTVEMGVKKIQALSRGYLVRQRLKERRTHLKRNVNVIVKLQNMYRAKLAGKAYRTLTVEDMPPTPKVVQSCASILEDTDQDIEEELDLERHRQLAVRQIRENQQTTRILEQLDIKIALLVRNRISLEEVVRQTSRHFRFLDEMRKPSTIASPSFRNSYSSLALSGVVPANSLYSLKNLDKESRKRLDGYQHLFYLLQTQPTYLARLLFLLNQGGSKDISISKLIETIVLTLFGFAQNAREEYLLLKLLCSAIKIEMDSISNIQEFLRGNPIFIKLAVHYNRGAKERKYLRDLLQPLIKKVLDDPEIDLESDPLVIYRSLIREEESRTGEKSRRQYDVTREVALNDFETRTTFIKHLRQLRTLAEEFVDAILKSLDDMPYGMRYIARELRRALTTKFPDEPEQQVMKVVGHLVYYRYINPAIIAPEMFDVIETTITPLQRKNLGEIAKILNQVSVGMKFNEDNMFLSPLNNHIGYLWGRFLTYAYEVTDVVDPEVKFQIDEFTDLATLHKPSICMTISEIQTMHQALETNLDYIAPAIPEQDPLRVVLQDLGKAPRTRSDPYSHYELQLELADRFADDTAERAAKLHRLFLETKRKWLTILRVQSGPSLLEILERPVTAEDESRWRASIQLEIAKMEERKQRHLAQWQQHGMSGRSSPTPSVSSQKQPPPPPALAGEKVVRELASLTFSELKRQVAKSMRMLETERWVERTRNDGYQGMLNAIARDIRTKAQRRDRRRVEMRRIRTTLLNLKEKSEYLESQRRAYEEYLASCTRRLAKDAPSSQRKMHSVLPFTRQYFHLRDLQRAGRVPRFGSYKYSAEKLYYKGVIISVDGYPPRQLDKISLTISSDEAGVFDVQVSLLGVKMPGGGCVLHMQDLLQLQYDNVQTMTLYEGSVVVNTYLLVYLINKKFYS